MANGQTVFKFKLTNGEWSATVFKFKCKLLLHHSVLTTTNNMDLVPKRYLVY